MTPHDPTELRRLPDWLNDIDEYVVHRLTNDAPLRRDAEMWIEHGADMLTKIKQQIDENAELRRQVAAMESVVPVIASRIADECGANEFKGTSWYPSEAEIEAIVRAAIAAATPAS